MARPQRLVWSYGILEGDIVLGLGMPVRVLGWVRLAVDGAIPLLGVHMVVRLPTLGDLAVARTRRHEEAAAAAADGLLIRRQRARGQGLEDTASGFGQRAQHRGPRRQIIMPPTGPQWHPRLAPVGLAGRTAAGEGVDLPRVAPESGIHSSSTHSTP